MTSQLLGLILALAGLALLVASASPSRPDGGALLNALRVAAGVHRDEAQLQSIATAFRGLFAKPAVMKTPTDLLHKFGYPSEVHEVVTEDGYILRLDRIPNPGRPVVYVANQLQASASSYILLGPKNALALLLFDAEYDVWLSNFRGNVFSQKHRNLTTKDDKFWDFSWHENGVYDNPANIDYILKKTGQKDLLYAGHSMGGTSFLAMGAVRPEQLKKIRAAFLLSPASYFQHSKSSFFGKVFEVLFHTRLQSRETWYYYVLRNLLSLFCPAFDELCSSILNTAVGKQPHNYYWKYIPGLFDYYPADGSTGQLFHYLQQAFYKKPEFRMYDYGAGNKKKYGQTKPPLYNLTNIQIPVYIYNGAADILCDPKDMAALEANLPNLKKILVTEDPHFTHLDSMVGQNAAEQMFNYMLRDMMQYTRRRH